MTLSSQLDPPAAQTLPEPQSTITCRLQIATQVQILKKREGIHRNMGEVISTVSCTDTADISPKSHTHCIQNSTKQAGFTCSWGCDDDPPQAFSIIPFQFMQLQSFQGRISVDAFSSHIHASSKLWDMSIWRLVYKMQH